MHTLNAIAPREADTEDALKVLGRVADAFDSPPTHKTDRELKIFMVNVVKSRPLLKSFPSEESMREGSDDASLDSLYEYGPRWSHKQRYRDEGSCEVSKMLLTSSPLDRLDRLARMELRKTGWIERVDKWTIVEMGLPSQEEPPRTPRRAEVGRARYDTPHRQIKGGTPVSMRSASDCEDSPCSSTLSYGRRFREQTRQVVRNIVRRMLPSPSVETPRIMSWSSGSASSWMEARGWSRH